MVLMCVCVDRVWSCLWDDRRRFHLKTVRRRNKSAKYPVSSFALPQVLVYNFVAFFLFLLKLEVLSIGMLTKKRKNRKGSWKIFSRRWENSQLQKLNRLDSLSLLLFIESYVSIITSPPWERKIIFGVKARFARENLSWINDDIPQIIKKQKANLLFASSAVSVALFSAIWRSSQL